MFTLKRKLFLIPLLGLLFGAAAALAFVNPYSGAISLSELTLQLSGSRGEFQLGFGVVELVELTLRWVPMFVFEMYLGAELYRFFCTASVYIFSRTPRRLSWYAKENAPCIFISAAKKDNVEEFRQMLYEEVKKVHLTRYPYDKLLYEDAWTQAEDAEAAGWETGVKGEEGRDEG